jgi:F420-dependent oxidoreductase-like protein
MASEPVTRLGLQIPSFTYQGVADAELFERVAEIAGAAEESGFDSVWVMDHLYQIRTVGQPTEPMLEGYTLLAGLAARTSRVNLGTMVTGVTYRNPAFLAKVITTLDIISSGRAILGIGAAWNEEEHLGYGYEFPPLRVRFELLEDALQICRAMFTSPRSTVQGKHHHTSDVLNIPQPVRPGGPPILIGGSGEKKTIPLIARYGDASNFFGDVETIRHKVKVLEEACEREGRDRGEITVTKLATLAIAETEAEAQRKADGLRERMGERYDQVVVSGTPDQVREQVDEFFVAGLDGIVFNMPDAQDLEPVRLAGETLAAHLGAGTRA